jgi:hypothetical protein
VLALVTLLLAESLPTNAMPLEQVFSGPSFDRSGFAAVQNGLTVAPRAIVPTISWQAAKPAVHLIARIEVLAS